MRHGKTPEVTTLVWRYTNLFIIINIIFYFYTPRSKDPGGLKN